MAWNPKTDPIVGGNTATGERYTRSGLVISSSGNVRVGAKAPKDSRPGAYIKRDTSNPPTRQERTKKLDPIEKTRSINRMSVKEQQSFLNAQGYKVDVDGVVGPQTKMARKAFINGVPASYWNKVWERNRKKDSMRTGSPGQSTTAPQTGSQTSTSTGGTSGTSTTPSTRKLPKTSAQVPTVPAPARTAPILDPYAYAEAATAAEYDPQIRALNNLIKFNQRAKGSNLAQIGDWGEQVMDLQREGAQGVQEAYTGALQGLEQTNRGVLDLFGGPGVAPGAGEAAAWQATSMAPIAGAQASQGAFDQRMQSILAGAGRNYASREKNRMDAIIQDLMQQRVGLQGARGQSYAKSLFEGQEAAQQAQIAQQSLDLARQMQPSQIATAQAEADAARAQADVARVQAKNISKQTKLELQKSKAELDRLRQRNPQGGLDLNDPKTRDAIASGALGRGAIGPAGRFTKNPMTVWSNLQNNLTILGLNDDPRAAEIVYAAFNSALNNSHAAQQWGGYRIVNGKLIYDPSKKFKKTEKK